MKTPDGTAALSKGLTLLNTVADAPEPLRFNDLLRESGLPKPTFARILRTLIAFGLVRQDDSSGTYMLGRRFLELSHSVWDSFDLVSATQPELERLAADLGETVALCRLDGPMVQYLAERSGNGLAVRVETGRRVPIHCTAAGKALLAFQDPALGRALMEQIVFDRHTPTTITAPEPLLAELTLTRARGYALSFQENLPDVNSVAAPIIGRDGSPIGALVALGPSSRLDQGSIHPVGRELIAAARRITGAEGAIAITSRPRPRMDKRHPMPHVSCVLPWGAQLGESPVWNDGRLYWVDILQPAVHAFDPATGRNETCETGKLVSAVIPAGGRLLVASQDGIEALDFATGALTPFANPEDGLTGNRLNDAKLGPDGGIWVGSMRIDATKPTGGLYRVDPSGRAERKEGGITVANGLGWRADGQVLYFVDTVPGIIYAYDCDPGTGTLGKRRVFARVARDAGRPDGLTVDMDGGVWCAIWDGWCLHRYDPNGKLDQVVDLPVPRPTSVAFGGADMRTLFVTSARTRLPATTLAETPLSGGIFAFMPKVGGPRAFSEGGS